jgi:hypothetical protein
VIAGLFAPAPKKTAEERDGTARKRSSPAVSWFFPVPSRRGEAASPELLRGPWSSRRRRITIYYWDISRPRNKKIPFCEKAFHGIFAREKKIPLQKKGGRITIGPAVINTHTARSFIMNCYVKNGQVRKIVHHGAPRPDIRLANLWMIPLPRIQSTKAPKNQPLKLETV